MKTISILVASVTLGIVAGCTAPSADGDINDLREVYADRTLMAYIDGYGTAIEYLDADGSAYLWTSKENEVVVGRWWSGVHERTNEEHICFEYFSEQTLARADGEQGAGCSSTDRLYSITEEIVQGDPFDLEDGGSVPFPLVGEERVSLTEAASRAALLVELGPNLADWRN